MSLRTKILFSILTAILIFTFGVWSLLKTDLQKYSNRYTFKIGTILVNDYESLIKQNLIDYDYYLIKSNLKKATGVDELVYVSVFDDDGRIIAYRANYDSDIYDRIDKEASISKSNGTKNFEQKNKNETYHVFEKAIENDNKTIGLIRVAISKDKTLKFVQTIMTKILLLLSISFVLLSLVLIYLINKFVQPISILRDKCAHAIGSLNLNPKEKTLILKTDETRSLFFAIDNMLSKISFQNERLRKAENEKVMGDLARKVSHDIRSPLAALKVVKDMSAKTMDMNSDQAKLLKMSIDRITDIANTILPKTLDEADSDEILQRCFLWMLIDQIISEKRVEYEATFDISIEFKTDNSPFELNAFCNPAEFTRSVSNLINNSIEAKIPGKKLEIIVRLDLARDGVVLSVKDNGKGMSTEVLSKALSKGFTHGKVQGTGLGLHQVKEAVESWNARIDISSQLGTGTSVSIWLKKSPQPIWLASSIQISSFKNMIVLDDDEYVFNILKDRFQNNFKGIRYFRNIGEFDDRMTTDDQSFLFIDYDLKQSMTGIDIIQKYSLHKRSVLLTGNYDDKLVQDEASSFGIKILPKPLINVLPIISG